MSIDVTKAGRRKLRARFARRRTGGGDSILHVIGSGPERTAPCRIEGGRARVRTVALEDALGVRATPEGLCWGTVCIPARGHRSPATTEWVDLNDLAQAADLPAALWVGSGEAALSIASPAPLTAARLRDRVAPDVVLVDLAGTDVPLSSVVNGRRVLVALAGWCGCRFDVATWGAVQERLRHTDVTVALIALDDDVSRARSWMRESNLPQLVDVYGSFASEYAIVNVPTVVWVDEDDRIVRPNDLVFGDNSLIEHHGLDCGPHHEELMRWATDRTPPELSPPVMALTPDELRGKAEYQLALHLLRRGELGEARIRLDRAAELAPEDLTIRRASIMLQGGDPMGPDFAPLYEEWRARTGGRSYRTRP